MINIVTATYNCENTIEKSILSVLELNTPVNYIIVDGKSTDQTLSIINKYSSNIDHVICENDNGIYDAWNKALKYIKKGWVLFLGSDDFILKENFFTLINNIHYELENYDLVCSKCMLIDENGNYKFTFGENYHEKKIKRYMCLANPSLLYNSNLFRKRKFNTKYKICSDYEFLINLGKLKTYYNPNSITKMTAGGKSNTIPAVIETFKIRDGFIPFYLNLFLAFKASLIVLFNK